MPKKVTVTFTPLYIVKLILTVAAGFCVVALAFMSLHIQPSDLVRSQGWVWGYAIAAILCIIAQAGIELYEDDRRDRKEAERDDMLAQVNKTLRALETTYVTLPPSATEIGAILPASKDRSRKPKLAFVPTGTAAKYWHSDSQIFEVSHIGGDPAQYVHIEPIQSDRGGNLWIRFDSIPYLDQQNKTVKPHFWLDIGGKKVAEDAGGNVRYVFFARDATLQAKKVVSYRVTLRFRWGEEEVVENFRLIWNNVDQKLSVSPWA